MDTNQLEDTVHNVEERVQEQWRDVSGKLRSMGDQVAEFVRERPVTAIAGAFAVGYLLARLARRA
jgi:ElaB/YqjD/DUF883 family membrane-anchored ribosome-binding protein